MGDGVDDRRHGFVRHSLRKLVLRLLWLLLCCLEMAGLTIILAGLLRLLDVVLRMMIILCRRFLTWS
jgi:hypothetical protein